MNIVDLPKPKGEFEIVLEGMVKIAKSNKLYYDELVKNGFTKEQAIQLVGAFKWF